MGALTEIVMHLARNPKAGFPEGDAHRGYRIVAPLDATGRLDVALWREKKALCTVNRFSPDEAELADGWLSHRGSHWYFRYDEEEEGPDEPLFRLGDHVLRVGEYVTVTEEGEEPLVYRVTETSPYRG
ncbi:MAG: hypothetical protein HXY28_04905 [Hydrogenophilaceae bacterium]|nr:hypothetical protein [Hydrogenophilaceae bacterium]